MEVVGRVEVVIMVFRVPFLDLDLILGVGMDTVVEDGFCLAERATSVGSYKKSLEIETW